MAAGKPRLPTPIRHGASAAANLTNGRDLFQLRPGRVVGDSDNAMGGLVR